MILLSSLFRDISGISKSSVKTYSENITDEYVRFIRPSKTYNGTFDGYVKLKDVPKDKVFPSDTIYVSTDGQGSHSYAYISSFSFVPNSNVVVLIPKHEIDLVQKHYYARCITANRYRFSYGRKPKGKKLKNIFLPNINEIPKWVLDYKFVSPQITLIKNIGFESAKTELWKWFLYSSIFLLERGKINQITKIKNTQNGLPVISATTTNNGIIGYLEKCAENPFPQNCITIANTGQSSVGFPTYQEELFYATNNITVLIPKFKCNKYIGLFLCTLIKKDRYKYSWGRILNETRLKNAKIKLPADNAGNPNWQFIEDYIKSLPYSNNL